MTNDLPTLSEQLRRFRNAYGPSRAKEGRGVGGDVELLALPYLGRGPLAGEWAVRARSFDSLVERWLKRGGKRILDLGAGNGWLCYRVALRGHFPVAADIRIDNVDGLAAGAGYRTHLQSMFPRVAASFEAIPFAADSFDAAIFNASLHYTLDLECALREAIRVVVSGGGIFIMDSPFYRSEETGQRMVEEKLRTASRRFGEMAADLVGLPFIEFLTPQRLTKASAHLGMEWHRHRVRYPLWYELRPLVARVRRRRPPSRFDIWVTAVP